MFIPHIKLMKKKHFWQLQKINKVGKNAVTSFETVPQAMSSLSLKLRSDSKDMHTLMKKLFCFHRFMLIYKAFLGHAKNTHDSNKRTSDIVSFVSINYNQKKKQTKIRALVVPMARGQLGFAVWVVLVLGTLSAFATETLKMTTDSNLTSRVRSALVFQLNGDIYPSG